MKTRKEQKAEFQALLAETMDLLKKSSHAEDAEMQPEDEGAEEAPESAEMPPMASEEAGEPDAEAATEMADPSVEENEPEGEEQDLAGHLQAMADEQLHELIDAALSELEGRSASAPAMDQAAPAMDPAMGPAAPAPDMEKNMMYKQMDNMQKSITALTNQLAKSQVPAKAAAPKVTSKPIPSNRVEVLSKSVEKATRLNKSETIDFLLNQQRKGNSLVNSAILAKANYAKTEEALRELQDQLTKAGVSFPKI